MYTYYLVERRRESGGTCFLCIVFCAIVIFGLTSGNRDLEKVAIVFVSIVCLFCPLFYCCKMLCCQQKPIIRSINIQQPLATFLPTLNRQQPILMPPVRLMVVTTTNEMAVNVPNETSRDDLPPAYDKL
jgi:hypothetical protein